MIGFKLLKHLRENGIALTAFYLHNETRFNRLRWSAIVLLIFVFLGCAKKKSDVAYVHVNLKKLDLTMTPNESLTTISNTTSEVFVHSYKIPIRGIAIENSKTGVRNDIYTCSGATSDDCLVDLATATPLTDLLGASKSVVDESEFDTVAIYQCVNELGYWSKMTTEVVDPITTGTYYSHANWNINTTGPAEELSVQNSNCLIRIPMMKTFTTNTNITSEINIYFDPRNLMRMGFSNTHRSWKTSGCSGDQNIDGAVDGAFVCGVPFTGVAIEGTEVPVVERYILNNLNMLHLYLLSDGSIIGGHLRSYFNDQLTRGVEFNSDVHLKSIEVSTVDATMMILKSLGSYSNLSESSYFTFENFQKSNVGDSEVTSSFKDNADQSQTLTIKRFD